MKTDTIHEQLTLAIARFVLESPDNRFPDGGSYFDEPLVGIASGNDPLFATFREAVGPFHWLPHEVMTLAGLEPCGPHLSIISWVLPVSGAGRESNRTERQYPSREWALTRTFGEAFNSKLRFHVTDWLLSRGIAAAAPQLVKGWRQVDDGPTGIASTWSERHAAYAAGLGTFSLNDGLITERGIAHRLGSVVAAVELAPTPHQAEGIFDNCLYHRFGRCGVCIGRCPVKAISGTGHDKQACMEYVYGTVPKAVARQYDVAQTGCGLCQTAVPCERINPCR